MDGGKKDELLIRDANSQPLDIKFRRFQGMNRSASMSIQMNSMESYESEKNLVSHTGPLQSNRGTSSIQMSGPLFIRRGPGNFTQPMDGIVGQKSPSLMEDQLPPSNEMEEKDWSNTDFTRNIGHLLNSGPLGACNDPYCTTCLSYYNFKADEQKKSRDSRPFDPKLHKAFYGDGWARKIFNFLHPFIPGVMNPHAKVVQQWNKFFVIACLLAIFVDPLFFFLLTVQEDNKCIVLNVPLTTTLVVFRTVTDFIYFIHMLIQFRLAYVAPESRVVGAGDFVVHPKKIALHYLRGYFLIDLFVVLPLPQIMILVVLPIYVGSSAANYAKNLLRATLLLQYIPKLYRFLPLLGGQSSTGFIFESAWGNFVINLLMFVLAGHVVGSCWYLLGLQRVNKCLQDACNDSQQKSCSEFIDCGHGEKITNFMSKPEWLSWVNNQNATACFDTSSSGSFSYGIYNQAVSLTTQPSIITRYVYSLFWGFLQISTLAGNQVPSYFVWEVLFTMGIIGLGLLLFALLIGNMQNFLQALGKRRLDMQLRRRDVEQWMRHRRLPEELRRKVRASERFNWSVTRGVDEEMLMEDLPEDLQREIRRHLLKFIKKVRIFSLIEDPILDAIRERIRQNIYIQGSKILNIGEPVEKMVFIVRGKMVSSGEDCNRIPLSEGDVCGEELLTWCLEHSSMSKDGQRMSIPGQRLLSNRTVKCLTNVEAFSLRAADLEEVTSRFARFLRNPRVQRAIRYESPYWRTLAAMHIQVAWRYRKKRLNRVNTFTQELQSMS
ncbi:probable cyclic nucleotide-gated ion channel 20, chloroplastic [Telopea speciosissima]|uniref:probable cyclic nucleotide-gated ion channel 20, chloroplastic n=1 Tax=Telopea speciosissima TaxID=54955 RepID=UPI001CC7863A|nr:probable cyclic nucleotide-gated ion channel 20, chloroplastic [Telopea speciosissima]